MDNKYYNIYLHRGTKEQFEELNHIYKKHVVIVEISEEDDNKPKEELLGIMCKFKIGDGIHRYKDLPYQEGLIPVAFKINGIVDENMEEKMEEK